MRVNEATIGRGQTADFSLHDADDRPLLVAELKVYYTNSYPKNLVGDSSISDLARVARSGRKIVFRDTPRWRDRLGPEASILGDFFRLRDYSKANPDASAYLLALIDTAAGTGTDFGVALLASDFGGPCEERKVGSLLLRCWRVN